MSRALDAFLGSSVGGFVRSPLCERESGRNFLERAGTSISTAHVGWVALNFPDRSNFPQLYLKAIVRVERFGAGAWLRETEVTFPDFCQGKLAFYEPGLESEGRAYEDRILAGFPFGENWILLSSEVTPADGQWEFRHPFNADTLHLSITLSQPASDIASRDSMMRNLIGTLPLPAVAGQQHTYWLRGDNTVARQFDQFNPGANFGGGSCAQWAAIDREADYGFPAMVFIAGAHFVPTVLRATRREYGVMKVSRSTTPPNCILDYIGVQELETNYDFVRPFLGADCGRYYTKLSCTNVLGNIQREMPAPEFNTGLLAPATLTGAYAGIAVARFNAITRLDASLGLIASPPAFIPGACCPA